MGDSEVPKKQRDTGAAVHQASTQGAAPDHPEKPPGSPSGGRRYPRHAGEVGTGEGVDAPGGIARVGFLYPDLRADEESILERQGGPECVSIQRRKILALALHAESITLSLISEFCDMAAASRIEGHVPHPSRWKCTTVLGYWIDLTARSYRTFGLEDRARQVQSLGEYIESRREEGLTPRTSAPSAPNNTEDGSTSTPAPDRPGEAASAVDGADSDASSGGEVAP
jgi:hypothetical protein